MSHRVYIDQILGPHVKEWILRGDKFVLEEDGDSGHGRGSTAKRNNPVARWKKDNSLETYFNCAESPDFAPIENCWQAPKVYVQKRPYFDEQSLIELLSEGWEKVSIPFINEQVNSIPQRLWDCL